MCMLGLQRRPGLDLLCRKESLLLRGEGAGSCVAWMPYPDLSSDQKKTEAVSSVCSVPDVSRGLGRLDVVSRMNGNHSHPMDTVLA